MEFPDINCGYPGTPVDPLDAIWEKVREFHLTFGQRAPDEPTLQPVDFVARRARWINEEVQELEDAIELIDQADAYLDILYFAIGGLVELGVRPHALFEIVHNANMSKLHEIDGQLVPVKNALGKIVKPEGWEPPEPKLLAALQQQLAGNSGEPR